MGKQNLRVGAGKSKWFTRLIMLAMGLVLSVGGVVGVVHFTNSNEQEYADAQIFDRAFFSGGAIHWEVRAGRASPNSNNNNRYIYSIRIIGGGANVRVFHQSNAVAAPNTHTGNLNLNNGVHFAFGTHSVRIEMRTGQRSGDAGAWTSGSFRYLDSNAFNITQSHNLAQPTNVRVDGDTLRWNAVAHANGYQIRVGSSIAHSVGNVTSVNLAGISGIPIGNNNNINVVATNTHANVHNSAASSNVSWTRSGTLGVPGNVRLEGSVLRWNEVASANQYRVYRNGVYFRTVGAVLELNLAGLTTVGNGDTFRVRARNAGASYWADSLQSTAVGWTALGVPGGVSVSGGSTLNWSGVANATHYRIYRDNVFVTQVAAAGASGAAQAGVANSLNLLTWAGTNDAGGSVIPARANMQMRVVAVNTGANAFVNSAQSAPVNFTRAGRVDSVSISAPGVSGGIMSLGIAWPRPLSVEQMPSVQLSANVAGIYGTDTGVTWSSNRTSVATVDAVSGFVRATWQANMWEHSMLPDLSTIITARSNFDNSVVGQFTIQVVFSDPPYAWAVGVAIEAGGLREIELPPCGSPLTNVTQFFASAYGYNLPSAMRGVVWSSSDTEIATIDATTGRLTAHSEGVVRITATSLVQPFVPSAFYITVARDGSAVATNVTIFCTADRTDEHRLVIPHGDAALPFVDLRAIIEGHNIASQLVTWTSSCGARIGSPSEFLTLSHAAYGVRVTGTAAAGPIIITATPVGAIGAVGTFRIFVAVSDPEVTAVTIAPPTNSTLLIPMTRPIETALPRVSLTASTSGFGGGTNSGVVWTSSCGAVAGVGIQNVAGQFVTLVLNHINPNVLEVVARDRGLNQFSQAVTITATSVLTPSQYASRILTIEQPLVTGITISKVMESHNGVLTIPYGNTEVANRAGVDLRAVIGTTNAAMSSRIVWSVYPLGAVMFDNARLEGQNVVVSVRPGFVGVVSIRATGAYCGTQSNEISLEIVQESVTSVRVLGPEGMFEYAMLIDFPRPEALLLPTLQLVATIGGTFRADNSIVWSSSCGGDVIEFLGGTSGGFVMVRAFGVGITIITATHPATGFYGSFTIVVDKSRLYGVEILGDGVVREQAALLITLEYADGTYTLESLESRQQLTLSLSAFAHGNVSGAFVWTSSNESVVRISGFDFGGSNFGAGGADVITSLAGFITLMPYGAGAAIVRATSLTDPSIYAEFTIFVTRGTASCNIQDGILDLPTLQTGDVRIILICEHYFGTARMSHQDMTLEQAQNFTLPVLTLDIQGAIFHGWSLSRGGSLLPSGTGNENGENGNTGNLPLHLLDLENGADTLLLFAVWYIPYIPSENGSSNLARNIIIGTLSVAGVGAAGTAGYIAQSKIRARRKENIDEWTMD